MQNFSAWVRRGFQTKKFTKSFSKLSSLRQQLKNFQTLDICLKYYFHVTTVIKQATTISINAFDTWNTNDNDFQTYYNFKLQS